jgi:hypothetical protein
LQDQEFDRMLSAVNSTKRNQSTPPAENKTKLEIKTSNPILKPIIIEKKTSFIQICFIGSFCSGFIGTLLFALLKRFGYKISSKSRCPRFVRKPDQNDRLSPNNERELNHTAEHNDLITVSQFKKTILNFKFIEPKIVLKLQDVYVVAKAESTVETKPEKAEINCNSNTEAEETKNEIIETNVKKESSKAISLAVQASRLKAKIANHPKAITAAQPERVGKTNKIPKHIDSRNILVQSRRN